MEPWIPNQILMNRRLSVTAVSLMLAISACTGQAVEPSSTTTTTEPTTTTTTVATTTTERPPDCPPPPYDIGVFPSTVAANQVPASNIGFDDYTIYPGSSSQIWLSEEGGLALALVRGALPPEEWPGERGEVEIDGARAVAGPFDDGSWVVAWFEAPGERCDQYTLVFYPPVETEDVQATLASMDRTAG